MRKIFCVFSVIFYIFTNNIFANNVPAGFADIVEPLMPAVVNIYTVHLPKKNSDMGSGNPFGNSPFPEGSPFEQFNDLFEKFGLYNDFDGKMPSRKAVALGSGFIIEDSGYIVTNHHVIKDADEINIKLSDNKELPAKVIGSDPRTDLALLKVDAKKPLPYVKFGDSNQSRVGDWIIAIGNPFGLGGTVTTGIVSSKSRDIDMGGGIVDDYIQTDAAINKGNSGGPMFNLKGEVIGVNTAIYSTSGGSVGIGFATPSNTASSIISQLKEHGKIVRGMLKIRIQDVSEEISESLGMKEAAGALVVEVEAGGPGDKAGIKVGDIITDYNNNKISSSKKLPKLVAETKPNSLVSIKVIRSGSEVILSTKLVANEDNSHLASKDDSEAKDAKNEITINGIVFSNLNQLNREKFGISNDASGIVVINIKKNSEWGNMGILRGDVISSINQAAVKSLKDFKVVYDLAVKNKKKNILLLIHRQNAKIFITMPINN